jgi:hypothetical protein
MIADCSFYSSGRFIFPQKRGPLLPLGQDENLSVAVELKSGSELRPPEGVFALRSPIRHN